MAREGRFLDTRTRYATPIEERVAALEERCERIEHAILQILAITQTIDSEVYSDVDMKHGGSIWGT